MFSANSSQVSEDRLYVEDVFSTYLYTNNGGAITVNNGIDLAGKGGLLWEKQRNGTGIHQLCDSENGSNYYLSSNSTAARSNGSGVTFTSSGFSYSAGWNGSMASWTFREAPKFFDVVTYTGNGASFRNIAHSLGITPGCVIIKRTDSSANWIVGHRSTSDIGLLNSPVAFNGSISAGTPAGDGYVAIGGSSATTFYISNGASGGANVNANGATYVAYLFAHDTTSDGIIQCGSYTGAGVSGSPEVNLGWEPQWVLVKKATGTAVDWYLMDTMRGMSNTDSLNLNPNLSNAESSFGAPAIIPTATGFKPGVSGSSVNQASNTYIYIAIRRGPMRTPTTGTSVFSPASPTGSSLPTQIPTGFPVDLGIIRNRTFVDGPYFFDRLRGTTTSSINYIRSDSTAAEAAGSGFGMGLDNNTGVTSNWYSSADPTISWNFRRAPSFFDEVCYTGTGSARTINHNLGVAPELMIVKRRSGVGNWPTYASSLGNANSVFLNLTDASAGTAYWNSTSPTSSVFSVGATASDVNANGNNYVAYLFASCPGVSKVTNFTGTGALQTINCGFASGARFVLIKRTDAAGDWYIYDSSRGISSANDPYLLLNSTAAEVTSTNWVDTDASGFKLTAAAGNNVNINGASYIALAIS